MLPLWIYLFNPWTETADQLEGGKRLPFGRLYVHVIGASGLMASDYAMFSKPSSDPYCQIEVGAIEKEIAKTHKINATLNPNWDEEFVMNVWRPRAILTLKVYDYDTASKDDHIGEVHVPIEMLRNQELHDLWFDLHPEPSDLRTEKAQKASLGRIRVRLQYKFSHLGEYLAHFLEKEIPEPEPFVLQAWHAHCRTADTRGGFLQEHSGGGDMGASFPDLPVHVNEELEDIYSVFDWSNPTVTRDVLLILIVTAIATSFVDLNYLLLAGGAIGLFCTSQIGQKVILFFKGIGKYTKTLRYKEFETSGNVHADAEIQKKIYRDIRRRTRSSTMEQTLRTKSQGHPKTASKT
ncbi:hypothetical protein SARC_02601 [Sphaeroforma arctica JP610]|uniref:C2 domain-containing protein n=1 Tax=Sphaeroforma arctica JP610 TaxID=667725 RepID=A0A0L0G861_9EUKA|nr:hypothetical protein SARC_02601 [Sphaeroforma arctica JP610]KNC85227.1 hypothetical protein SARC_02601 [Sphaeroforma arctica JP610]|eukprot:XP_014159129.1 hypothetical protein SARC_02601 [Sphaeroforma arctica JP610]